jgi:hypothetical protein
MNALKDNKKHVITYMLNKFMAKQVRIKKNVYSLTHQIKEPWNRDS